MTEHLVLVNADGVPIGTAPRSECHGRPELLHAVAHALVFVDDGKLLLQLRSAAKDVCPGLWDTSVGGHLDPGEDALDAIRRETREELGIECLPEPLYSYVWQGRQESEFVHSFVVHHNGPFTPNAIEIDAVRLWSPAAVQAELGSSIFTPNFEHEWKLYQEHLNAADGSSG